MKALCISHSPGEGLGSVGEALESLGFSIDHRYAHRGGIAHDAPEDHALAVFMGGPMGVYQADIFPWIHAEISYIKARLAHNLPTLGICLGSQLMAAALGQSVRIGAKGKEIGWKDIEILQQGAKSPVRHFKTVLHWHGDTYDIPEDAELLAATDLYPQAYSYGRSMALQFHPEATEETLEGWIAGGDFDTIEEYCGGVPEFRKATRNFAPQMRLATMNFMKDWLETAGVMHA